MHQPGGPLGSYVDFTLPVPKAAEVIPSNAFFLSDLLYRLLVPQMVLPTSLITMDLG